MKIPRTQLLLFLSIGVFSTLSFAAAVPEKWISINPKQLATPQTDMRHEVRSIYSVEVDGDRNYLHAKYDVIRGKPKKAIHLGRVFGEKQVALSGVKYLEWRWRVRQQPSLVDSLKEDPWLDMAVSVYVLIKKPSFIFNGQGFKFGWLAIKGPTNTTQRGLRQIQMRTGDLSGLWVEEQVDLCALYEKYYGSCDGEYVEYIGVMTDADGTKSIAEGDYSDLRVVLK